jgi:hypothetical protein
MKKVILTIAFISVCFGVKAQNTFPITGNVGIGTTAPNVKFHVDNGDNSYGSILANASEKSFSLYTKTLNTNINSESFRLGLKHDTNENNGYISFFRGNHAGGGFLGFSTNGVERIRVDQSGNVGIGTTTPDEKLTVNGNVNIGGTGNTSLKVRHLYGKSPSSTDLGNLYLNYSSGDAVWVGSPSINSSLIVYVTTGIGTASIPTGYKLAIAGKVITEEVKVQLQTYWPDFVFEKNYQLPTLKDVEKHIKEKGHLKDIPSEEEVLKNGILLGEMNAKLLQKIEELTLYAIAQEKKLKKKDEELKILSERMTVIEKLLKSK